MYIGVWSLVSASMLVIGRGCLKIGNFLRPYGKWFRGFGRAFQMFGLFGAATVVAGLFRYSQGIDPTYQGVGLVAWVRTICATLFWVAIAIATEIGSYRFTRDAAQRSTIIEFHRQAFKLRKVVEGRDA